MHGQTSHHQKGSPSPADQRPQDSYVPRRPEDTTLYQVVQENWETFREGAEANGGQLPHYVRREFESYLGCGILANGFLRLKCDSCEHEKLVPFSCKRRGFCPSCCGRRMSESAAFFVDHILPEVPIRQWVLSTPMPLRFWMARNPRLLSEVLTIVIRVISGFYRLNGKGKPIPATQTGSITLVQRFGGSCNLNIHFHSLFIEGSYEKKGEEVVFRPSPLLTDDDVQLVLAKIQVKVMRLLKKRGLISQEEVEGPAEVGEGDQSLLDACVGASVQSKIALGERAGGRVRKLGSFGEAGEMPMGDGPLCATLGGFSLHAAVATRAHERERLEQLCRYITRPPIAESRLSLSPDGNIVYRLKKQWGDGTQAVLFSPTEFIEKLTALIPQPRIHITRFHGVLAPNASLRSIVIPNPSPVKRSASQAGDESKSDKKSRDPRRLSWAELLKRVFQIDVTVCPDCGGALNFIATIMERKVVVRILDHLKLPSEAPRRFAARAPPQSAFDFH